MIHTTFALAKKAGACLQSYKKMAEALGGLKKYGKDTPIPLVKIVEIRGLSDGLWVLRCTIAPSDKFSRLLACDYAEHVLHNFEGERHGDTRVRDCIEVTRRFARGNATLEELSAAGAAAWSAEAAAWAGSAEQEWQQQHLLEMLHEREDK